MTPFWEFIKFSILLMLVLVALARSGKTDKAPDDPPEYDNKGVERISVVAEPSQTSMGALGQGFDIHKEDLLSKPFKTKGATIFADLPQDKCTATSKLGTIERFDSFYRSTESLYQSVSSSTKLGDGLKGAYSLGKSVGAVTNSKSSSEAEVQGTALILKAYSLSTGLKKECMNRQPLNQELMNDFETLDKQIQNPWKLSSWSNYKTFLKKYGSHIVKESISGASIYQYVFGTGNGTHDQPAITAKACLALAGAANAGKIGIPACLGVSQQDMAQPSPQPIFETLVVRGGKAETRASMTGVLSPEQINNFLMEAETDPSPIQYIFYPIWTILKTRYIGTEHFAKAMNLEQFYKGFLYFGCPYQNTTDADNKLVEIQKFDLTADSDPEAPTYVCKIAPQGCHHDSDCKYRHAFWCECGGPREEARSCLKYKTTKLISGSTKEECFVNKEPGWASQGCKLSIKGCRCTSPSKVWKEIWTGEDADKALRDVNMVLREKKSHYQAKKHHLV